MTDREATVASRQSFANAAVVILRCPAERMDHVAVGAEHELSFSDLTTRMITYVDKRGRGGLASACGSESSCAVAR